MTDWEKRARELLGTGVSGWDALVKSALQLGAEMADERERRVLSDAEILERARDIYCSGDPMRTNPLVESCLMLRINDLRKPKTREQILEEALREIGSSGNGCSCRAGDSANMDEHTVRCSWRIARRALEQRP